MRLQWFAIIRTSVIVNLWVFSQKIAKYCNILRYFEIFCDFLQEFAKICNKLQKSSNIFEVCLFMVSTWNYLKLFELFWQFWREVNVKVHYKLFLSNGLRRTSRRIPFFHKHFNRDNCKFYFLHLTSLLIEF